MTLTLILEKAEQRQGIKKKKRRSFPTTFQGRVLETTSQYPHFFYLSEYSPMYSHSYKRRWRIEILFWKNMCQTDYYTTEEDVEKGLQEQLCFHSNTSFHFNSWLFILSYPQSTFNPRTSISTDYYIHLNAHCIKLMQSLFNQVWKCLLLV